MVFGLFSKDRSIKRAVDLATSVFRQSADRFAALEKLKKDGSEEAIFGLFRRFSITADKTIDDVQEKEWVVEALVEKGAATLGPLRRYMKDAPTLGYPLVILGRIGPPAIVLEVIDGFLASEEPGYTHDPKRKTDVIEWLGEWTGATDEEVARRVAPYLADFDEGVRFKATETLAQRPHPHAAPALAAALVRPEEESKRLKLRIAEVLAANGYPLGEHVAAVSAMLGSPLAGYKLQHDKLTKP
jgi:HEAT repeat protein